MELIWIMLFLRGADLTNATLDDKWARIADLLVTGDGAGQDFSGYDMSGAELDSATCVARI